MPIIFDEISSEIAPERGAGESAPGADPADKPEPVTAEFVFQEIQLAWERARRLHAD